MIDISDEILILSKIVYILNKFNIKYINKIDINLILEQLTEDKEAFLKKDPSAKNNSEYLLLTFSSFDSVIIYRIANYIFYNYDNTFDAKRISEYAKTKTGIEIHPCAKIGKRFVIDHGVGTVIGETCVIGDDCYLLQKVILGSTQIAFNKQGKRHPTIMNNVEIGGFVRIFGPIKIGNNVKISPHSIITTNIPDNSSVIIKNNEQVIFKRKLK